MNAQELPQDERQKVEAALPDKPLVVPKKERHLLIFDRNVNYGGHRSIPTANFAFKRMGEKTGAFATEISREPSVFGRDSLRRFDVVFFNNNVGNLFEDPELRRNLAEFVYSGGGLLGVHGTAVGFTRWPGAVEDWPEFGLMLGARGANHKASDERVFIRIEGPENPITRVFTGSGFEYRDEFFRVHEPYSRERLRVLLSIDTEKTDMNQTPAYGNLVRADNDYALAWVQNYGRGRTFYCTIAHNPSVFWDPRMLQFYLGAVQFALGDLAVATLPSGKLTPAARAQEQLNWRTELEAGAGEDKSLCDLIDAAARLHLGFVAGSSRQRFGPAVPKLLDAHLSPSEMEQIRLRLATAGIRMSTFYIQGFASEPAECQRLFEFARKMGVETIVSEAAPQSLDLVEPLADTFEMNVALQCAPKSVAPGHVNSESVANFYHGRSNRLGVAVNLDSWLEAGVDAKQQMTSLGDRLLVLQIGFGAGAGVGSGSPESTWQARVERILRHQHALSRKPLLISFKPDRVGLALRGEPNAAQQLAAGMTLPTRLEFFDKLCLQLAKEDK